MEGPPGSVDPWDTSNLPFTRVGPVYVGVGVGAAIAIVWLLADRPSISFTAILVIIGALAGGIAAAIAPAGRRSTRFLDVAYPALVAGVSARFFAAIGQIVTGNDEGGEAVSTAFAYFFVTAFFVGFPVLVAKVFQNPARRLPDAVLAQIGEPYPTRREPKLVTVRADDGTTHRVSVLRGGFVAGVKPPFDIASATGIVRDDPGRPGAKGGGGRGRSTTSRSKGTGDDPAAGAPTPTSRTTPKGTTGNRKRPKR